MSKAPRNDTGLASATVDLVDLLTRTQRALVRDLGAVLEEEGTSVEQWRVLRALSDTEGSSMGELAAAVEIPHPTLTRLVDTLADAAYLYRTHSSQDRRRVSVHISELGRRKLNTLEALAAAHEQALAADLGPDAIVTLSSLLRSLWAAPRSSSSNPHRNAGTPGDQVSRLTQPKSDQRAHGSTKLPSRRDEEADGSTATPTKEVPGQRASL